MPASTVVYHFIAKYEYDEWIFLICCCCFYLMGSGKTLLSIQSMIISFNWTFTRHKYHVKKGSNHLQNGIHLELRLIIWYIEASIQFKRERGKGMSPIWSRLGAWDLTPGGYHSVGNGQGTWSLQVIPLLYSFLYTFCCHYWSLFSHFPQCVVFFFLSKL